MKMRRLLRFSLVNCLALAGGATLATPIAAAHLANVTGGGVTDTAGSPIAFGGALRGGGASSSATNPVVAIVAAPRSPGYWIAKANGNILPYNGASFWGAANNKPLKKPVVGMASTQDGRGYWLVASDGGIFAFGDARFHGSTGGIHLNKPIVAMASTSDGAGYWLVASDGGIFAFGDARFHGSTGGIRLSKPIVGMAPTSGGAGYWLAASDGGVFSFGDAHFLGSEAPNHALGSVVAIVARPGVGEGYWLASTDAGVYGFGAKVYGSIASSTLPNPIVSMAVTASGNGYWLLPTTPPPPPVPPLPPGFVKGHVTAIGDSVMVDVQPDLDSDIPNIDVNAAVSRQWDTGVALAQQLRASNSLGATVIVDLGTNGPVDMGQFQAMMSALSGAILVVFVTVHLPPSYSWSQSVNATLEAGVKMYSDTRIADFNALADMNPQWFGSDGVHMPIGGSGAQAMASLITTTIRNAEGKVP